jgi:hypothetical protein
MLRRSASQPSSTKFFVSLLVAIGAWSTLVTQSTPHAITSGEWSVGLGYLITAAVVWLTPNTPASGGS